MAGRIHKKTREIWRAATRVWGRRTEEDKNGLPAIEALAEFKLCRQRLWRADVALCEVLVRILTYGHHGVASHAHANEHTFTKAQA